MRACGWNGARTTDGAIGLAFTETAISESAAAHPKQRDLRRRRFMMGNLNLQCQKGKSKLIKKLANLPEAEQRLRP